MALKLWVLPRMKILYIFLHLCTSLYIRIRLYTSLCIFIRLYTCLYVFMHFYTSLYILIGPYTFLCIFIRPYTCLSVFVHVHTSLYIFVHLYASFYIFIPFLDPKKSSGRMGVTVSVVILDQNWRFLQNPDRTDVAKTCKSPDFTWGFEQKRVSDTKHVMEMEIYNHSICGFLWNCGLPRSVAMKTRAWESWRSCSEINEYPLVN